MGQKKLKVVAVAGSAARIPFNAGACLEAHGWRANARQYERDAHHIRLLPALGHWVGA